jgi:hypothetical protein
VALLTFALCASFFVSAQDADVAIADGNIRGDTTSNIHLCALAGLASRVLDDPHRASAMNIGTKVEATLATQPSLKQLTLRRFGCDTLRQDYNLSQQYEHQRPKRKLLENK